MPPGAVIELIDVSKTYRRLAREPRTVRALLQSLAARDPAEPRTAVDGLSLRVEPGEMVGLIGGNGADLTDQGRQFLEANPHLKFFNSQRGYVRVTVDQKQWKSDFRVVPYVETPNAPITTRATYVVEDRRPHVHSA